MREHIDRERENIRIITLPTNYGFFSTFRQNIQIGKNSHSHIIRCKNTRRAIHPVESTNQKCALDLSLPDKSEQKQKQPKKTENEIKRKPAPSSISIYHGREHRETEWPRQVSERVP